MTVTDDRLASGRDLFDDLAEELLATEPAASRSTMMGFPCLRVGGVFAATFDHRSGDLVVKVPAARALELVEAGVAEPFAPAGRPFREWVCLLDRDEPRWRGLLDEAVAYARTGGR